MAMKVTNAQVNGHTPNTGIKAGRGDAPQGAGDFLKTFRLLSDSRYRTTPSGLKIAILREGTGKPLANGMRVKADYTGWTKDGKKFDSSVDRGRPIEFTLGTGRMIKGWEEGLMGIKPGERRQLVIPAELAYGNRAVGDIPPGSTLVFNVEAVAVEEPAANPKGTMNVVA